MRNIKVWTENYASISAEIDALEVLYEFNKEGEASDEDVQKQYDICIEKIEDLEFKDEYAFRRSRNWYQKELKKHFTFVSSRVLESKVHFKEEDTFFTDLVFRF